MLIDLLLMRFLGYYYNENDEDDEDDGDDEDKTDTKHA